MKLPESHPYWHVRSIIEKRPDIQTLQFSYYSYQPQTVADVRTTFNVSRKQFIEETCVEDLLAAAPPSYELAIDSCVALAGGEQNHLVMVDMSTSARAHLLKLRTFLGEELFAQMTWFESGRSFHGYGNSTVSERDWMKFMGLLLLANQPNLKPTVDPRWIGHRILAGYSSLRWSKRSDYYLSVPARVDQTSGERATALAVGPLGFKFGGNQRSS